MYDYPKFGKPRSDAERRRRHKRLYGKDSTLPKRGSGKGKFVADAIKERNSK